MAKRKLTQQLIVQVVLGEDAQPSASITNGLEVKNDSTADHNAGSENELSDVAGASLSPRGTITGTTAGNASINGYLKSTDGTNEPAIGKLLQMSGMSQNDGVELTLTGTLVSVGVRDEITGSISGAVGVISAIDGDNILVKVISGTFEVGDEIESGIDVASISTNANYVYNPDSDSDVIGSIYVHNKTNVTGIQNCRGNVTISAEVGAIPTFAITALGRADVANRTMTVPSINYEDSTEVVFKDSAMKLSWDGNEYIPENSSFEWNLGSAPQLVLNSVKATGIETVANTSRADAGGSIVIYMDDFGDFDAQTLKNADTVFDLQYRIGNGDDNRTIYVNQRVMFGQISTGDSNGLITLTIPLKAVGESDDETILVFK